MRSQRPETVRSAAFSEHGLEPGKGLLDRVEVGAVGREEAQARPGVLDQVANRCPLVARQVVHDDNVAWPQFRHENLADVGFEPVAIDRPVEHHGRDHPGRSQSCHQCGGLAMAVREAHRQGPWLRVMLVAVQVSSMKTSRSGSRSSWPSNHSSRRFRTSGRSCSIAWPVFFTRDAVTIEEPPDRADPDQCAAFGELPLDLGQCDVALLLDQREDEAGMRFDPAQEPVAALLLGNRPAVAKRQLPSADR